MKERNMRGTILLDVTVAVFIVSVGLLSLLGLFVQCTQAGNAIKGKEQAALLAAEKMEMLRNREAGTATAEWLTSLAGTERLVRSGGEYERTLNLSPRTDLAADGCLWEVEICMVWQKKGGTERYGLVTYLVLDGAWGVLR